MLIKRKISRQENQLLREKKIHVFHSFLKFSKTLLSTSKITGGAKSRVGGLLSFQIRHDNYLEMSRRLKEHDGNVFGCISSVISKTSRQYNQLFREQKATFFTHF